MKTSEKLYVGRVYTRTQLQKIFGVRDATIRTGVFRPKGHASVWLFVTEKKPPDRTQYSDYLDGDILYWDGQLKGRTDQIIIGHEQLGLEMLLFYREKKSHYPGYGFRYEGPFEYVSHKGSHPTHFTLRRILSLETTVAADLDSLRMEEEFFEGEKKKRFTTYYERDPQLRTVAILYHGTKCMACGFDFEKVYGRCGSGYIEVHHLRPVSSLEKRTLVDPKVDMIVVCSNCHRMIHRRKDKVLSLEELKKLIRNQT